MAQSQLQELTSMPAIPSVWAGDKPTQKGPEYYKSLSEQCEKFVKENECHLCWVGKLENYLPVDYGRQDSQNDQCQQGIQGGSY